MPEPAIISVEHGFWVETADDTSEALLFDLAGGDGTQGRPTEYPVKRIEGHRNESEAFCPAATQLAVKVWARWAREQQQAGVDDSEIFDGDGSTPLPEPLISLQSLALAFDAAEWESLADGLPEPPATESPAKAKRQPKPKA